MSVAAPDEADRRLVDIMVAYQNGEMEGFEQLFEALATNVRNYLVSLSRDFDRAEDLLQETFLQVHRSRQTYSPPRPVKPWVFGVARYVYLMDRRSKMRKAKFETTAKDDLPELPVASLAEGLPVTDELRQSLNKLSADRREAVLLHHVWGFSFREIGGMLGISERAAKLRSFRGIQDLRAQMAEGDAG
jgi:RNA polymerase sigma-70 factor (ECF subfamily)